MMLPQTPGIADAASGVFSHLSGLRDVGSEGSNNRRENVTPELLSILTPSRLVGVHVVDRDGDPLSFLDAEEP